MEMSKNTPFRKKGLIESHPYTRYLGKGWQYIYRFPNGYGASIIPELCLSGTRFIINEDRFELAIIKFIPEPELDIILGLASMEFNICYDTPITDDVIRNLSVGAINKYLRKIEAL